MSLEKCLEELADSEKSVANSSLVHLSDLSPEAMDAFKAAWGGSSPDRRRKVVVMLVELAEENVELDFTAIFRLALSDEAAEVRAAAVSGLWECEERALIDPLMCLLKSDPAEEVRAAAAQGLRSFAVLAETGKLPERDGARIGNGLLAVIDNPEESLEVRRRAIEAVAPLTLPRVPEVIQQAYESDEEEMKASALYAMGCTCDQRWLPTLLNELENGDPQMRYEAAVALGEMGDEEAVPDLVFLINDPDSQVQAGAIEALGGIGGPVARKALAQAMENPDRHIQESAEAALQALALDEDPAGFRVRP